MTDRQSPRDSALHAWTETGRCETHGEFKRERFGPLTSRLGCPQCEREREAAQEAQWKARLVEDRRQERIAETGLIGRFRAATFETFEAATPAQRRVLKSCQEFAAGPFNEWRTLWLQGPVGVGKTHLLAALALATVARERSARVITARELVRRIRCTWRNDAPESEEDVLHDLAGCGLLCLDELGVGYGTDGELLHLLDVLDLRYRLGRPTAIATNLTPEQVRAALGDRLFDRLAENSTVRACDWPSYRRRGAA